MAVYLGESGCVELRRNSQDEQIFGTVAQSDVNPGRDRFSFDFVVGTLLTGDQAEIKTTDDSLLDFIGPDGWPSGQVYKDGLFYLSVDEVGAIKLYRTFDEAIAGEPAGRVSLVDPGRSVPISVEVRNNNQRILAQVSSFELNTERDSVDISALSDEFRRNTSGLISGSGRIECFFEYDRRPCDPFLDGGSELEVPMYVNQLILRTQIGSEFFSKLTLIRRGPKPYGGTEDADDEVWYEFEGRITNVGMAFVPDQPIRSTIDFVTTGEIKLLTRINSNYLLQEDFSRIELEPNQDGFLEVEQD
jgi:hypothetical protein